MESHGHSSHRWDQSFDSIEALRAAGFAGFATAADLAGSRCAEVPVARGVYAIVRESALPPVFLSRSVAGHYRGRDPSMPIETLTERWVAGAIVLFIGEAGGTGVRGQLQQRIKRHVRFGGGAAIGARGGRFVWQLRDHRSLLFSWIVCGDAGEWAAELRAAFQGRYGALPFANEAGDGGES
jgi:hypothetical protein